MAVTRLQRHRSGEKQHAQALSTLLMRAVPSFSADGELDLFNFLSVL
jgi:hypothetical protein